MVGPVGGAPVFSTKIGQTKVRSVAWAGEDHLLVSYTQTAELGMEFRVSQAELLGVLAVSLSTGKAVPIFHGRKDVANVVEGEYGTAEIGGRWYGFFGGITNGRTSEGTPYLDHTYPDLYRVDLDTGDISLVMRGSEASDGWLVGPDGQVIATATYNEDRSGWRVRAGSQGGGRVLASGQYAFGGVGLSRGRSADTVLIDRPSDKGAVEEEISLSGAAVTPVPDDDIDGAYHDRATGLWIGYSRPGDQPNSHMFDPLVDRRVAGARKAFAGAAARLVSWNSDFSRMVMFTTGGDDSGTYWMIDIPTGKADPIGYEYPTIGPASIGPIRMVQWKAGDGTVIHGVLSLPPGREAKGLSVVVLPHGGPEARDYPVFDWWAQAFAARGYAVLQPNFRGSSGYGQAFRDAGFNEWGRKMQTDVSDGLADLARQGIIDARRACIVGGSYGGYAALAGVTLQHGFYRCAVSVAGVSDLGGMIRYARDHTGSNNAATRYWQTFMGPTAGLDQLSPALIALRADAPILLIHGKDDTVVPFDQSQAMQRGLNAAGKPVEMVVMPGEDHWLSRETTRQLMLKSAVAFVEKYDPPDAPAKP